MAKPSTPSDLRGYETTWPSKPAGEPARSKKSGATRRINLEVGGLVYQALVEKDAVHLVDRIYQENVVAPENAQFSAPPLSMDQSIVFGHVDFSADRVTMRIAQETMDPAFTHIGLVARRTNPNIRALTTKFVKTQQEKAPTTPRAAKKQTNDLSMNLEQIIEAIVETKLAERVVARANDMVAVPEATTPAHTPGYAAAVQAGADVRARIISGPGMVSSSELAKLMGVSRETVNQKRQKGSLLALTHGTRLQRYPTWQLELKVGEAMPDLLETLQPLDPWTQYLFITQGIPALDGTSPLDALRAGERDRVVAVAAEYADLMAPA